MATKLIVFNWARDVIVPIVLQKLGYQMVIYENEPAYLKGRAWVDFIEFCLFVRGLLLFRFGLFPPKSINFGGW